MQVSSSWSTFIQIIKKKKSDSCYLVLPTDFYVGCLHNVIKQDYSWWLGSFAELWLLNS